GQLLMRQVERRSTVRLDEDLESFAERDAEALHSSYAMVRIHCVCELSRKHVIRLGLAFFSDELDAGSFVGSANRSGEPDTALTVSPVGRGSCKASGQRTGSAVFTARK
ncbi:MAG: hypothetical protein ACK523_19425, partial [Pirellulaceae bacterium]